MKKNITALLNCCLVLSISTSALAAPQSCPPKSLIFNCRSRGPITIVAVRSNQTYGATANSEALTDGAYRFGGTAYRFTSGGLQDKSIIWKEGKIYLVDTKAEDRAAELARFDGAAICIRS